MKDNINLERYFDNIEINEIVKIITPEFEEKLNKDFKGGIYRLAERIYSNNMPSTADNEGIAKWEDMLYIYPFEGDTLDTRRDRIYKKILNRPPITMKYLREWTKSYFKSFDISVDFVLLELYIDVEFDLNDEINANIEIVNQLNRIVKAYQAELYHIIPANLLYMFRRKYNVYINAAKVCIYTGLWAFKHYYGNYIHNPRLDGNSEKPPIIKPNFLQRKFNKSSFNRF